MRRRGADLETLFDIQTRLTNSAIDFTASLSRLFNSIGHQMIKLELYKMKPNERYIIDSENKMRYHHGVLAASDGLSARNPRPGYPNDECCWIFGQRTFLRCVVDTLSSAEFIKLESLTIRDFLFEDMELFWGLQSHDNYPPDLKHLKKIKLIRGKGEELLYSEDLILKWIQNICLTSLTLHNNNKDDIYGQIPEYIFTSQSKSLEKLNLSEYRTLDKLSDMISGLTSLKKLTLYSFAISESVDTWKEVCQSIQALPNLKIADLGLISYTSGRKGCRINGICTRYGEDKEAYNELRERMSGVEKANWLSGWQICDKNHVQYDPDDRPDTSSDDSSRLSDWSSHEVDSDADDGSDW